jgi:hypothetical protein
LLPVVEPAGIVAVSPAGADVDVPPAGAVVAAGSVVVVWANAGTDRQDVAKRAEIKIFFMTFPFSKITHSTDGTAVRSLATS